MGQPALDVCDALVKLGAKLFHGCLGQRSAHLAALLTGRVVVGCHHPVLEALDQRAASSGVERLAIVVISALEGTPLLDVTHSIVHAVLGVRLARAGNERGEVRHVVVRLGQLVVVLRDLHAHKASHVSCKLRCERR